MSGAGFEGKAPDVEVTPGPLSRHEIQRMFGDHESLDRLVALANEADRQRGRAEEFAGRLAKSQQVASDQRALLEKAARDELAARTALVRAEWDFAQAAVPVEAANSRLREVARAFQQELLDRSVPVELTPEDEALLAGVPTGYAAHLVHEAVARLRERGDHGH